MKAQQAGNGPWFTDLLEHLGRGLLERELPLRLSFCAALAGESVFLYGPPGTAKSLLARRLQTAFADARIFDYLMGRFSTPEELFGPLSIAGLRDHDRYERKYQGYLPDADIVFLDEIWKAGPPIQNALLTALNEKIWRNGQHEVKLPLKCLLAASNETCPNHESLAFWDRFLLRLALEPIQDDQNFIQLLQDKTDPYQDTVPPEFKISAIDWARMQDEISSVELGSNSTALLAALRQGLNAMVDVPPASDRRWKKIARLLRASAFLHGRTRVEAQDFALVPWCLWHERAQLETIIAMTSATMGSFLYNQTKEIQDLQVCHLAWAAGQKSVQAVTRPLMVEDEYYLLEDCPLVDPGQELRIWYGDFDELDLHAHEIELFIHQDGRYVRTVTHKLTRGESPWTLRIEGTHCSLRMPGARAVDTRADNKPELERLFARNLELRKQAGQDHEHSLFAGVIDLRVLFRDWDQVLESVSLALESASRT